MADNSRYKQSNNPILSKYEKVDADKDFSAIIANAGLGEAKVALNDVIVKTAIMFGLTVVFAVVGWSVAESMPYVWIGAAIVGMVLGLINAFKKKISVPLMLLYAVAEGLMLGGISKWYNDYAVAQNYQGLVLQAVIGTMTAFGVMLFLYATGIVKVGSKFKKVMLAALISYALIGLVSLVAALFGVGGGWGFYGVSGIGLLLCAAGVLLASFTLLLDFDAIKQGIAMGLPEKESWRMAFGLELTLIWLYLEILRLLAIVAGRN
jgi:uncharacterized YccA/Bax inhibitor family protein